MFALDSAWAPIAAVLALDPVLAPHLVARGDFRPFRPPSIFEALVNAILGHQVHRDFARRLCHHLVESFGASRRIGSDIFYAFPTPGRLSSASVALLRELQLSSRKAEFVLGLAQRFCRPVALTGDPDRDVTRLMKLPGVGRWSAEYALMQGTNAQDMIPAGDAFLQASVGRLYGLGEKATEEQVRRVALAWRPFRSWGTHVVWYGLPGRPARARVPDSPC